MLYIKTCTNRIVVKCVRQTGSLVNFFSRKKQNMEKARFYTNSAPPLPYTGLGYLTEDFSSVK
jgi:hypothetical protein